MKKLIYILIFLIGFNSFSISYLDNSNFKEQILFTATSDGKIIVDDNSDIIFPIASLTKIMNVLVALDEVKKGNFSLNDKVIFDKETVYISGGQLFANPGDSYVLRDLLKMELVHSSNNAAYLVAKFIGKGDISNFVKMMNNKAKEIGLQNTYFASPAGLPPKLSKFDGMDVSNAKDLYLLTNYAIKNTNILEFSNIKSVNLNNFNYDNRNTLLGENGVIGLKTGFHSQSGFNFVVVSKIGETIIISISMNSNTISERNLVNKRILEILEQNKITLINKNNDSYIFDIKGYKDRTIEGYLSENVEILDVYKDINYKLIEDFKEGNIKKGDKIGIIEVYEGKVKLFEKDIFASKDNRKLKWYEKIIRIISFGYF